MAPLGLLEVHRLAEEGEVGNAQEDEDPPDLEDARRPGGDGEKGDPKRSIHTRSTPFCDGFDWAMRPMVRYRVMMRMLSIA